MERIFTNPRTIQRYRSGPLSPYVQQLAERLHQEGYKREKAQRHIYVVDDFGRWLARRSIAVYSLTFDHAQRYLRFGRRTKKTGDRLALRRLFEMLAQEGRISQMTPKAPAEIVIHEFGNYLSVERALADPTITNRKIIIRTFLTWRFGKKTPNLSSIEAGDLIGFLLAETKRRGTIKDVGTSLRTFMKYLLFTGHLKRDLSIAVPTVPNRRLGIPRPLAVGQVKRILASCNRHSHIGRRDYAILLLLARLGLRSGEVEGLRVDDVDWIMGTLTVLGKGGKIRQLPLLHDVGQAISVYLQKDRRSSPDRRIFQRTNAPWRGLSRTVGSVVRFALERAGVKSPSQGGHQFRYTLGSQLLAKGASLVEIGGVLRHESPRTTFIYTKVDLGALRPLARHWPGGAL